MKITEIAKNNSVSVDDVEKVCKDLGISYDSGETNVSDSDSLFIRKKIESLKADKAKHAEEQMKQDSAKKKIRLKQKVDTSMHTKSPDDKKPEHAAESVAAEVKPAHPVETGPARAERPARPAEERSSDSRPRNPFGDDRPRSEGYQGDRPRGEGYQGNRPRGEGYQGDRPRGEGYQGNRPRGEGYQGNRPQGQGYQGDRPRGEGYQGDRPRTGYQGNRPQGQGYQGDRPRGEGYQGDRPRTGYQGNRPQGQGYQGNRPQGQGYQGNRPQGQGYQGNRPQGQGGQGGFRRDDQRRGPGGPGRRPMGGGPRSNAPEAPATAELEQKNTIDRSKRKEKDKEKETKRNRFAEIEQRESSKAFSNRRKKDAPRETEAVTPKNIEITESISVGELAKKLNVKANDVIAKLMKMGFMATINQVLDAETAEILAGEYGTEVKVVSLYEETVIREEEIDNPEDNVTRPPIVTVMGHVDHGKTKLLDAIRSANVIDSEWGGITQHIGAYQVDVHGQKVTFFDTPGHAAFTTMRARGASVTDIVILVVAANDGVMPQTVEAISHAKAANVPIIVAINKIDLPEANPAKVRQELTQYEIVPEEWGGTNIFVEISAKQKLNINGLLEAVLVQSEVLDLKANPKLRAKGTVIESKIEPGKGTVCTLLVQNGSISVGDFFVCGIHSGKIRAMFDDKGKPIQNAGPSTPIEILGVDGIPSAGDPFQRVISDRYAKQIAHKRQDLKRVESAKQVKKVTLESLNDMIKDGSVQELVVVIKADVDGSVQALKDALEKLSTSEVRVKVIHSAAGGINESDVMLASASNAIIIGYHVRPLPKIAELAEQERVSIKTYNIIFEVTDDIRKAMEGMLAPDIVEEITGHAEVRQTFKISKIGTIAGCILTDGKIQRTNKIRVLRDGIVVFEGELKSLKRFKDDASEVVMGQECGIGVNNYNDLREKDIVEFYKLNEIVKKL